LKLLKPQISFRQHRAFIAWSWS